MIKYSQKREKQCRIIKIIVSYFCGYLEKEITKEIATDEISSYSNSCELCGSHGSTEIDVNCECGHLHSIEIKSW